MNWINLSKFRNHSRSNITKPHDCIPASSCSPVWLQDKLNQRSLIQNNANKIGIGLGGRRRNCHVKKILRGNNLGQALSSIYHLKTDKTAILLVFSPSATVLDIPWRLKRVAFHPKVHKWDQNYCFLSIWEIKVIPTFNTWESTFPLTPHRRPPPPPFHFLSNLTHD